MESGSYPDNYNQGYNQSYNQYNQQSRPPNSNIGPINTMNATPSTGPDTAGPEDVSRRLEAALFNDSGIDKLLNRLRQSIFSATDFSRFLREKANLEEKYAQGHKKLIRHQFDTIRRPDARQGSYIHSFEDTLKIHDRMTDTSAQYATNLFEMASELQQMAEVADQGRKRSKHEAIDAEKRVRDAEVAMHRARDKYNTVAERYERARMGDMRKGTFGLKNKSPAQQEEQLKEQADMLDHDYTTKTETAKQTRYELDQTIKPSIIQNLSDMIAECDAGLSLQMQKLASLMERHVVGIGMAVSPLPDANSSVDSPSRSLRQIAQEIDNRKDFHDYVLGNESVPSSFSPRSRRNTEGDPISKPTSGQVSGVDYNNPPQSQIGPAPVLPAIGRESDSFGTSFDQHQSGFGSNVSGPASTEPRTNASDRLTNFNVAEEKPTVSAATAPVSSAYLNSLEQNHGVAQSPAAVGIVPDRRDQYSRPSGVSGLDPDLSRPGAVGTGHYSRDGTKPPTSILTGAVAPANQFNGRTDSRLDDVSNQRSPPTNIDSDRFDSPRTDGNYGATRQYDSPTTYTGDRLVGNGAQPVGDRNYNTTGDIYSSGPSSPPNLITSRSSEMGQTSPNARLPSERQPYPLPSQGNAGLSGRNEYQNGNGINTAAPMTPYGRDSYQGFSPSSALGTQPNGQRDYYGAPARTGSDFQGPASSVSSAAMNSDRGTYNSPSSRTTSGAMAGASTGAVAAGVMNARQGPLNQHPSTPGAEPGPRQLLPPNRPVFGNDLETLALRDGTAVSEVVFKCISAVERFGMNVEGIYRLSGSTPLITYLKSQFDHGKLARPAAEDLTDMTTDASQVQLTSAASFDNDIASVAAVLKTFLRDLPDPLLTRAEYSSFITAAKHNDVVMRRDSLHQHINSLPDPNYATLRVLTLHLHRLAMNSSVNKMDIRNLAIVFGPTVMGGSIGDTEWQTRVMETILNHTYEIFDPDESET